MLLLGQQRADSAQDSDVALDLLELVEELPPVLFFVVKEPQELLVLTFQRLQLLYHFLGVMHLGQLLVDHEEGFLEFRVLELYVARARGQVAGHCSRHVLVPEAELGNDEAYQLLELLVRLVGLLFHPPAAQARFHFDDEIFELLVLLPELLDLLVLLLAYTRLSLCLHLLKLDNVALEAVSCLPQLCVINLKLVVVLLHELDLLVLQTHL